MLSERGIQMTMENKPFKFTEKKQFEYLYTTMEENLHIAIGSPVEEDLKDFWENLARILNKIGPLIRTAAGWEKIWNEHKCFIMNKIQKSSTPVEESVKFTHLEKNVAHILHSRSYDTPASSMATAEPTENDACPSTCQPNGARYRIKVNPTEDFFPVKLPPKIPQSAKDTILKIQEETHKYLQRMTKIEEERLKIEKKELDEKIKFREELALLVHKVRTDISMSLNL